MNEWVTIKEASNMLGVSEKTIRRRIQRGEIEAKLKDSPYGQQYFILKSQIHSAQQIMDVIQVRKEYSLQELSITLSAYLRERDKEVIETMNSLKEEVAAAKEENKKLQEFMQNQINNLKEDLQEQQEAHLKRVDYQLSKWLEDKEMARKSRKGLLGWFKKT